MERKIFLTPKKTLFWSKNTFGLNPILGSEKFNLTIRSAVLTIESTLGGNNCHQDKCCMWKWLSDSCLKILFL